MISRHEDAPPDPGNFLGGRGCGDAPGGAVCGANSKRNPRYQTKWRNAIRLIKRAPYRVTGETARARRLPAVRMSTPRALSRVRETSDSRREPGGAFGLGAGPEITQHSPDNYPGQVITGKGAPVPRSEKGA